ncbi:hypothetical protein BT69DRAFT_1280535 [Atractiella rhizophila]|nr:hypothetical protein BT69DRAFT_1287198 [Atractiella rhizophila]KAH8924547.1 hypothetical protein BT69DRAFT_1280535 [Atractiella rhizophila]
MYNGRAVTSSSSSPSFSPPPPPPDAKVLPVYRQGQYVYFLCKDQRWKKGIISLQNMSITQYTIMEESNPQIMHLEVEKQLIRAQGKKIHLTYSTTYL